MPGNLYDDEDFQKQKEFRQKYYPQVKGVSKNPIPGDIYFMQSKRDIQFQVSANRNLITAFNQLNILKDKLGLPDAIIEKTAYIYRKARERGLVRGRETSSALAACSLLSMQTRRNS